MRRTSLLPFFLCVGMTASATAGITRFEVASSAPYGKFKPGDFVRVEGTVTGELSPGERIPGLDPERYANREDYVERIRAAAQKLVAARFMIESDAEAAVRAAQSAPLW